MITPEQWSRIVSASVVPVVIISACGLLCLSFYNRMAGLISRLRSFQRERLEEQEEYARTCAAGAPDSFAVARHQKVLDMLELQTAHVLRRARRMRQAILCVLGTIACLTVCSFATGVAAIVTWAKYPAAATFCLGIGLLLAGVVLAMIEIRGALDPVELESRFVSELEDEFVQALTRARRERGPRAGGSA